MKTFLLFLVIVSLIFGQETENEEKLDNLTVEEKADLLFQSYYNGLRFTMVRSYELSQFDPEIMRNSYSECVWQLLKNDTSSCKTVFEPYFHEKKAGFLAKKIAYDVEQLQPLLKSQNISDDDFLQIFQDTLNTRGNDFSVEEIPMKLLRKYFWQAVRPGSYGSNLLTSEPFGEVHFSLEDQATIIDSCITAIEQVDSVASEDLHSFQVPNLEDLKIALNFNLSEISRASKLKLQKEADSNNWMNIRGYLLIAANLKPQFPIFVRNGLNMPQAIARCLQLRKQNEYREFAPYAGRMKFKIVGIKAFNIIDEDDKFAILTRLITLLKKLWTIVDSENLGTVARINLLNIAADEKTSSKEKYNSIVEIVKKNRAAMDIFQQIGDEFNVPCNNCTGEMLARYNKTFPTNYRKILMLLLLSTDFRAAHERFQRKILWEIAYPPVKNDTEISELPDDPKQVSDEILTSFLEEIKKTRIMAKRQRNDEIDGILKMAEIFFSAQLDEEGRTREFGKFLQFRKNNHQSPSICSQCYQRLREVLNEKLTAAKLDPVSSVQKALILGQNQNFRDFGVELQKKILKGVVGQGNSFPAESVDSAVFKEVSKFTDYNFD